MSAGAVALTAAVTDNWWDRYGPNYHGPGYWGGGGYWGAGGYHYTDINNIHNNVITIRPRPPEHRPERPWFDRPGPGERPGIGERPGLGDRGRPELYAGLAGGLAGGAAAGLVGNIYHRPGNSHNLAERRPGQAAPRPAVGFGDHGGTDGMSPPAVVPPAFMPTGAVVPIVSPQKIPMRSFHHRSQDND